MIELFEGKTCVLAEDTEIGIRLIFDDNSELSVTCTACAIIEEE